MSRSGTSRAKSAGLPVFKLLGAQRYGVPAYAAYPAAYDTVDGFRR